MTDGGHLAVSGSPLHDRRVDIAVPDCGGNPVIEAAFRRHLQGQAGVQPGDIADGCSGRWLTLQNRLDSSS
uniref:hypothetical protein n=1 Tax=unclassified Bradyrhizobium TaxID=2631580 RepID=UPI002915FBBA